MGKSWKWLLGTWWDGLYDYLNGVEPVNGTAGLLRVRPTNYHGRVLQLQCGLTLHPGDKIAELHIAGARLLAYREGRQERMAGTMAMIRAMETAFGSLARATVEKPALQGVKAFYGVTLLWPAAARFGFEVREIPAPLRRWGISLYERNLERWYNSRPGKGPRRIEAREVWISSRELQLRFGSERTL